MRRGIPLLFFLLILATLAIAQEQTDSYNGLASLQMSFSLESGVDALPTETPNKIGFIQADLSFFPSNEQLQTVSKFNANAQPTAKVTQGEEYTTYKWTNEQPGTFLYTIDATVQTKQEIANIRNRIKFPITTVEEDKLEFTQPTKFIDLDPLIEQSAYDIIGGETDLYKAVFKLADWTRTNIDYDLNSLTAEAVQKSSWVLKNREGVCDEMTNLFISFARSVGIPARFVSGMVYTNIDYAWGPHGWAEVYFPEHGWVPFDVTFGQYGWLDASHITLKHSADSGSPSAEYSWQATGVEVKVKELQPSVRLLSEGASFTSPIELTISPLRERVGFGSHVPLLVTVTNKEAYYVSTSLVIKKAPELEENNVREILLEPGETKTVGWLITIPEDLDEKYIYTGALEVETSFKDVATAKVIYAAEYPVVKEKEANKILNNLKERELKTSVDTIKINCETSQDLYYKNESAIVDCTIRNTDTTTDEIDVCLRDQCQTITLSNNEQKDVRFNVDIQASGRIPITAETTKGMASTYVPINLVALPEFYVTDLTPDTVKYKDEVELSFNINSDAEVQQAKLAFIFGDIDLESFKGSRKVTIDTDGKSIYMQGIKFTATFLDGKGESNTQHLAVPILIQEVPWYAKVAKWIRKIL